MAADPRPGDGSVPDARGGAGLAERTARSEALLGPGFLAPLVVGAGGALGSLLRYEVARLSVIWWGAAFPWGTLIVNVVGCVLIGVYLTLVEGRLPDRPLPRLFTVTGFLGGLTTLSAFAWETVALVHDDRLPVAGLYVVVSVGSGMMAVLAGGWLARTR